MRSEASFRRKSEETKLKKLRKRTKKQGSTLKNLRERTKNRAQLSKSQGKNEIMNLVRISSAVFLAEHISHPLTLEEKTLSLSQLSQK